MQKQIKEISQVIKQGSYQLDESFIQLIQDVLANLNNTSRKEFTAEEKQIILISSLATFQHFQE